MGAAMLCSSTSCVMSFRNSGFGDLFGGVGGHSGLKQVDPATLGGLAGATHEDCPRLCGDCTQGTWDAHPEGKGEQQKLWCMGEGDPSSKTKFGRSCCTPPPTPAPATQAQGTISTDSSYKGEGAGPIGGFLGEVGGDVVEGYKIRMY